MTDLMTREKEEAMCSWCGSNDVGGTFGKKERVSYEEESDMALAKEMNELSVKEREKVLEDIHGVTEVPEESPEFVKSCLGEMDIALTMIPKVKRKAYDRALFFKPSIQQDSKFKLMFLRTDYYDAQKAANRMVRFFEEKLIIFGEDKLVKKLTLDDLHEEDLENLGLVGCAVLPYKDQTNRPIWHFDMSRFNFDNPESMYRCNWYQIITSVEDDDTAQLKGICDIAYCPGDLFAATSSLPKISKVMIRNGRMIEALPCRVSTFHFCYNDPRVKYVVSTIGNNFGKQVRLRIRTHYGSDVEMQYSLMTFGVVCDFLFSQGSQDEKRRRLHDERIESRRLIEREQNEARILAEQKSSIILNPQPGDVLVGRGRPYQEYPGNTRLGSIVEAQLTRYRNTEDRFEKTCIILEVVKTVRDAGGRFIQKAPGGWWKLATDKAAREKTCSAFRSKMGKANSSSSDEVRSNESIKKPIADVSTSGRDAKRFRYDPSFLLGR